MKYDFVATRKKTQKILDMSLKVHTKLPLLKLKTHGENFIQLNTSNSIHPSIKTSISKGKQGEDPHFHSLVYLKICKTKDLVDLYGYLIHEKTETST